MQQITSGLRLILPFVTAALFALLPKTFKNGIYFGTRLTEKQRESSTLRRIMRTYEVLAAFVGIILSGINIYLTNVFGADLADIIFICILFSQAAVFLLIYTCSALSVSKYAKKHADTVPVSGRKGTESGSVLPVSFAEKALCPSLWWYLMHTAVILFGIAVLYVSYDEIASYVPLWCDFFGNASAVCEKSPRIMCLPVLVQIIITLICMRISFKIRSAPLSDSSVRTREMLDKNRRNRMMWTSYVCAFSLAADIGAYMYINLMFLNPAYKAAVSYILFILLCAGIGTALFAAYALGR